LLLSANIGPLLDRSSGFLLASQVGIQVCRWRTWGDPALTLSARLTGARYLKLVLTDGGNTNSYDRGDWAAPRLTC
jgi:hypothetical protein